MSFIDLLYKREALKIEFLVGRDRIKPFIVNSYALWTMAQFRGNQTPADVFYGAGGLFDVAHRQLARRDCLKAWEHAKATGETMDLVEHVATVMSYTKPIAEALQDHLNADSPYDAMVQFQTPGFVNPLSMKEVVPLLKRRIRDNQREGLGYKPPMISPDIHDDIVDAMMRHVQIDFDKVEVIGERYTGESVPHPSCLGYGGNKDGKGVKLGLTHNPNMTPIKSLLTNWHEIGHAAYRQHIPYGQMVPGRAMDEAMAFLFEYAVGSTPDFKRFLLDEGLARAGYTMDMLDYEMSVIVRDTSRIETNPVRHIIDIELCEQLERAMLNEDILSEECETYWAKIIEPYKDILPDHYPYYADVHMMSGIYGDRACYTPGLLAAFQLETQRLVVFDNLPNKIKEFAQCEDVQFDKAVEYLTGRPLSADYFMRWVDKEFSHQPKPPKHPSGHLRLVK